MAELSDPELVIRCRKGDRGAFEMLVDRYQTPVYNAALRILHDPLEAEDVSQCVFLKVYENLDSFDSKYKLFSWIYRIAVNESLNARKSRRRYEPLDDIPSGDRASGRQDDEDVIDRALGRLSPEDRAVVILKHLDGFSYNDIGFIMDWPNAKVKSRLYAARQHLKEIVLAQQVNPRA